MKKTIIIGVVITLGIIGFMWWGKASQTTEIPQNSSAISLLTAQESLYDFGTVSMKNGLVSPIFSKLPILRIKM